MVSAIVGSYVLCSEHLIYQKNHEEPLIYGVFLKNKGVTFHSWGHKLIPESMVPEEENVNKYMLARL